METIAKCWHYKPKDKTQKANCINCNHWTGKGCKDQQLLIDKYQESEAFKAYDHMMRSNKGVTIE
ncbi:hypothetical protein [Dehalobacter sp. TeCB1]|uniref:hypothetical protein n=1 Tax=Dehalobacter sp. TeCB1 TaxID=1843715 RepID=UPI00083B389B|nr:hypothetical protein [Dehalobacter sp. TeCB1]OCZ54324.1 hypothetical protein A7D23_06025 [Dehalobacter sp. TeCB1]